MRYAQPAYRGHNPRWAFSPTSGAGAAIHGGRFNPRGVEALYLATTPEGAFVEATQGLAYKFDPLTLCAYEVDCTDIVDLRTPEACAAADTDPAALAAPWALDVMEKRTPASWRMYYALAPRAAGILVPSFAKSARAEMTNLVLWRWSDDLPYQVRVHDPQGRLPSDQSSWVG